jgi:protein TonB
MTAPAMPVAERRVWGAAGGVALVAHLAVAALVMAWPHPHQPRPKEPVLSIDLPPMGVPEPVALAQPQSQPQSQPQPEAQPQFSTPRPVMPPIDVPEVRAPVPRDAVTLPPAPVQQVRAVPVAAPAPVAPQQAAPPAAGPVAGDSRTKKAELDYFAQISARLNQRKSYPAEARKARQQGVVIVRFTVDREGAVSGAAIKRGSGFDLLDAATLDLLRRVAPLPRMPAAMARDTVTISLPIEYSLKTS